MLSVSGRKTSIVMLVSLDREDGCSLQEAQHVRGS